MTDGKRQHEKEKIKPQAERTMVKAREHRGAAKETIRAGIDLSAAKQEKKRLAHYKCVSNF